MKCTTCKVGETRKGKVTVKLEKGSSILLIKKVPAQVCTNCGSYFLDSPTAKKVLEKGRKSLKNKMELEVLTM